MTAFGDRYRKSSAGVAAPSRSSFGASYRKGSPTFVARTRTRPPTPQEVRQQQQSLEQEDRGFFGDLWTGIKEATRSAIKVGLPQAIGGAQRGFSEFLEGATGAFREDTALGRAAAAGVRTTSELFGRAADQYLEIARANENTAPEIDQPENWREFLQSPEALGRAVGTSVPNMIGSIGVGVAATAATGGVGAIPYLATFGTAALMEGGFAHDEATRMGATEEEADKVAALVGTVNGAIELMPFAAFINKAPGANAIKSAVARRTIGAFTQAVTEGTTESVQEIVSNALHQTYDEERELFAGVPEAFIVGSILGGPVGFVSPTGATQNTVVQEPTVPTPEPEVQKPRVAEPKVAPPPTAPAAPAVEATPSPNQALLEEARKYDSAEEFIAAQGEPLLHGTRESFTEFDISKAGQTDKGFAGQGVYLTNDRDAADFFSKRQGDFKEGGNIIEAYADVTNTLEVETFPEMYDALGISKDSRGAQVTQKAQELGYDSIKVDGGGDMATGGRAFELVVFDPAKVKTRQQLETIYNQAQQEGGVPAWWNEPSDNVFAKDMTKGEVIMDWLERNEIKQENGKYVLYHATPVEGGVTDTIRKGSYLTDDPASATHQAIRDRGLSEGDVRVIKLLLNPWELDSPGTWVQLRNDYAIQAQQEGGVGAAPAMATTAGAGSTEAAAILARKNDIDIRTVEGTGSGGRVTVRDVRTHVRRGGQTRVEPTEGVSKTAKGVKRRAIEQKLIFGFDERFSDLPEYDVANKADQAEKAMDLVLNDPDTALQIALGNENPPPGVLASAVYLAVELDARERGDVETLARLATESTLPQKFTGFGQEISMLSEQEVNSPVWGIQTVHQARTDVVEKKLKKRGTTLKKEKSNIVKEVKEVMRQSQSKRPTWEEFVEQLNC